MSSKVPPERRCARLGLKLWTLWCLPLLACTGSIEHPLGAYDGHSRQNDVGNAVGSGPPVVDGPKSCPSVEPAPVEGLLRLSNEELRNVFSDLLGSEVEPALLAAWPPLSEVYGFDTMGEARIDARALDEQLRTSDHLARRMLETWSISQRCGASIEPSAPPVGTELTWETCGRVLVDELASRAFRRPLRPSELPEYETLFTQRVELARGAGIAHPFYDALFTVVQSILLSPDLMFVPELSPGGFDPEEQPYRTASRLARYFRASVPDDALWEAAASGELNDPAVVNAQAVRLMQEYAPRFLSNFAGQWLGYRSDATGGDALLSAMRTESEQITAAVLTEGLPPSALLTPGFTLVDAPLAEHYGLPFDPNGDAVQRLNHPLRGGLLAQGYFLKRTAAGSDFRRAIHRGLWTLTRLLCREMPRLDAATVQEISASLESIDRTRPLGEQMAIHRTRDSRCGGCHGQMDPVGLALEKFDDEGLWREVDSHGHPIVSDLELFGVPVAGPKELSETIAGADEYRTCVAEKLLTFALNRGPRPQEVCMATNLTRAADGDERPLSELAVSAILLALELTETAP